MKNVEIVTNAIDTAKSFLEEKAESIDVEATLRGACKVPGVKINREKYLRKELQHLFSTEVVDAAIRGNPAQAGIAKATIDEIAKKSIQYETTKVSAVSFVAGLPGGTAMYATVPADVVQYFAFILRIMQKLAFLYGFGEFSLSEDCIDDGTMNKLLIFLGVMFGVQEANTAIKILADTVSKKAVKTLAQKALTKGTIYPLVKKIATAIGAKMTKQIFADSVGKIIPIIGGVITCGLTYSSFKPCSYRLKETLSNLPISDPDYYREQAL